ncbi:protein TNT [Manis pentadactyla]|uniref:protein TNT n=1 Tax=Manis pentadactyla TaxID=143292 RepID=UPI001875BF75|nr:protein TNT [Manis pentadactyla]
MSIYYVLGRKLGTGDIAENKESESLPSPGLTFQQRESAIDKPHQHSDASQSPLHLDKPIQLPPISLQDRKGDPSAWNAQGQDPSLEPPSLEPQSSSWVPHDTGATQEPLRVSSGNLGDTWSSKSDVKSTRQSSLGKCSDLSRLSSGYVGDENSKVSLLGSGRIVRLSKRLPTKASSSRSSQLCVRYSPSQLRSQPSSQADTTKQTGEEK